MQPNNAITYVGRAAYIVLSCNCRARVEFITRQVADKYEAIRVTNLNAREGIIDELDFLFDDYFTPVSVGVGADKDVPHIWTYRGKTEWYVTPSSTERTVLAEDVRRFILLFA